MSFVTNTNWQSYGGETTLSHFSQMAGLTYAELPLRRLGMAVAAAVARGFAARSGAAIGNFWVDLTRAVLYVLLPGALLLALVLLALGVPQTLQASVSAATLEGAADHFRRARRQPARHQAAWHKRRRLLQRQLGPPAREPQRDL